MEKFILTKEQAEALKLLKGSIYYDFEKALRILMDGGFSSYVEFIPLNNLDLDVFVSAWINGYDIKKTAEEKILEEYMKLNDLIVSFNNPKTKEMYLFGMHCIKITLDIQGTKIKGINC